MRGQPVEVKQQEPYLGFILHEDGFVQSVMVTTKEHINRLATHVKVGRVYPNASSVTLKLP